MPEVDFDINVTDLYDAIGKSDWDAASHACLRDPVEAETWVVRRDREPRDADDDDASVTDDILWRFLPLHSACARRPPSSFLRDLLRAYPEAASLKDESGMYPLHYACGNRASNNVIKQLVDCFPLAVREIDPQGMLPIHYVAQWGPSEDGIVELLLDVYAEGMTVLNGEEMSPLDLCREGNFDLWEDVLVVLERRQMKKKRDGRLALTHPRTIEGNDEREDTLLSSMIKKSPRSSSRSRRERSSSRSKRQERSSSRSRSEERLDSSPRSKRSSSRSRAKRDFDARDEISTPRDIHHCASVQRSSRQSTRAAAARSVESLDRSNHSFGSKPHSITCSLPSPQYFDAKTPRSSGRGPSGFHFGQKTPTSGGRSVDFDFENESTIPSQESSKSTVNSHGSIHGHRVNPHPSPSVRNQHLASFRSLENRSQGSHDSHRLNPFQKKMSTHLISSDRHPSPSLVNHQSDNERLVQHLSQEKEDTKYQVVELRTKLANYDMIQNENTQLQARLANYDAIQNENAKLHAKLANYDAIQSQNAQLHEELARLQDVQTQLSEIVDITERQENARVQASAERRKMLLEMLDTEEKQDQASNFLYKGETLGRAFGQQIRTIDGVRREMVEHLMIGGGGAEVDQRTNIGYRMNGVYE